MPEYKLTYFPIRARAEVTRMLFRLAGEEFEDNVVEFKDWPKLKAETPFGQIPLLEAHGQVICQSYAINNYLARKFGYAGKTEWEQAQVHMVAECAEDFIRPGVNIFDEKNEEVKEQLRKQYAEQIPFFMNFFEKMLSKSTSGYFVGDEITWADLTFAECVRWPKTLADLAVDLTQFPKCKAAQEKTHSHPVIAAYLSERWPETDSEKSDK